MAGHRALTGLSPCSTACSWLWLSLEVLQPIPTLRDGATAPAIREAVRNYSSLSVLSLHRRPGGGGRCQTEKEMSLRGRIVFFSNKRFHHLDHIFPNLAAPHATGFDTLHLILTHLGTCPLELFTTVFV